MSEEQWKEIAKMWDEVPEAMLDGAAWGLIIGISVAGIAALILLYLGMV